MHDLGLARDDVGALVGRHRGVLEEAACVAHHGRVGQLGAANVADPVKNLLGTGVLHARLGAAALQIEVAQHGLPGLGQPKPHMGDDRAPRQAHAARHAAAVGCFRRRMLEDGVAVAKAALRGIQAERLAGGQIEGVERFKPILQLHAIGTDVLHGRGAHRARDERQIFQPWEPVRQRPGHSIVPDLARARLHDPGLGGFLDQP